MNNISLLAAKVNYLKENYMMVTKTSLYFKCEKLKNNMKCECEATWPVTWYLKSHQTLKTTC